ncbi:globin [Rhizobium sp. YIM 134829]|uniref:globin domain-containing protein n=1 Tax=Rhizobium sp. YIM 134829 TaxID=3390453 RepID=UPI00397CFEAB
MEVLQTTTLYDAIGGEATVRRLVQRFYVIMDTAPEAAACRAVHPPDLAGSEAKLYDYFTGWLGGPPLYTSKHGHPMLRRRHFAARIGQEEIEGWIFCFDRALEEAVPHPRLRELIREPILKLAHHMHNAEG